MTKFLAPAGVAGSSASAGKMRRNFRMIQPPCRPLVVGVSRGDPGNLETVGRPSNSGRGGLLEPRPVLRPELRHLGADHGLAVALPRVTPIVALVVVLGGVEGRERGDLGHDGVRKDLVGIE